ncbi:acylphosphatase, partial [Hydrogenimonas sp.]|uniref:acylphosphatase n=1 Tax=Hydrogenimonas sp. TaxID=2231112 RepID=UPI002620E4E8
MRWRCKITGIVQGVGFRPAIYRYATELGLMGFVRNDADGVTIEVEGEEESLKTFLDRLGSNPPPLARIDTIATEQIEVRKDKCFVIFQSHQSDDKTIAVSPDISICDACVSEMADPSNRRYRYPFINCTDCGPRYTITKTVPYDRSNTSMAKFDMCEACRKEYENPLDRRYHAQPIACRSCGPSLSLWLRSEKLKV